jgi:hypothetical protein
MFVLISSDHFVWIHLERWVEGHEDGTMAGLGKVLQLIHVVCTGSAGADGNELCSRLQDRVDDLQRDSFDVGRGCAGF